MCRSCYMCYGLSPDLGINYQESAIDTSSMGNFQIFCTEIKSSGKTAESCMVSDRWQFMTASHISNISSIIECRESLDAV